MTTATTPAISAQPSRLTAAIHAIIEAIPLIMSLRSRRMRIVPWLLLAFVLGGCGKGAAPGEDPRADPRDARKVALGAKVYAASCASCHGAQLEGQPDWRRRRANGRLPAPPHDESGHTWHHPDDMLFNMVKHGVTAYAPPGYESDMPAFAGRLSDDEIWAVLACIKSHWKSREVLDARAEMLRNLSER